MENEVMEEYWKEINNSSRARKIANGCAYQRMTELLLESRNVDSFFEKLNIESIAIYGVEGLGKIFYKYVSDSSIRVDCFIDQNYKRYNQERFNVIGIDEIHQRKIQGIVIAILDYQCEIMKNLVLSGFDINKIFTVNSVLYGVSIK